MTEDAPGSAGPPGSDAAASVADQAAGRAVEKEARDAHLRRAVARFQAAADGGNGGESARQRAFGEIYEAFFRPLTRFFARKGFWGDEGLDLTQEAFLGIYKGLDAYEDRQRFSAWVYRIATTTLLKHVRRASAAKRDAVEVSRDAMEQPELTAVTHDDPLHGLVDAERKQALRAAVAELPEQMRDCLVLRLHHQLPYREIAEVKEISVETVKAHLARARKKLRERLGDGSLGDLEARSQ